MGLNGGGIPGGMGPPGGTCMGIPCGGPDGGGPIEGSARGGMKGGAPETGGMPCGPPGGPDEKTHKDIYWMHSGVTRQHSKHGF